FRWAPGEGVELWAQRTRQGQLFGPTPHFSGLSRIPFRVEELYESFDSPLDGCLFGWADAVEGDPISGAYNLWLEVPNLGAIQRSLIPPRLVPLRLSAFAHELSCYTGDADFQARSGTNFAPESFFPGYLLEEDAQPPRADACFAGHILRAERRINPV